LPHLKGLEKDKILISKNVGKNKVYSLNFDNILTKYYLITTDITTTTTFLDDVYLIKKITKEIFSIGLPGTVILFGSYAKKSFNSYSDIDLFYLGNLREKDVQEIKKIGEIYGKTINIKISSLKNFEKGIRKKDPLIIEIIKDYITLQNSELFVNMLWRHFNEKR